MRKDLIIQVINEKDATGIEKRVIISTLRTDLPGMERLTAVAELDSECQMGKEIDDLIERMLSAKQDNMKVETNKKIKRIKEKVK
jgi:hypothetical protein